MKSKDKIIKLMFMIIATLFFTIILSINSKTMAVTINGTVLDENNSPIQDIEVKYGSSESKTNSNGFYEVESSGNSVQYVFQTSEKYKEAKAYSIRYETTATNKKYNVVIVKPESGYESEYQEIQQMLDNCNKENEKVITYTSSGFSDGIQNPYQEYKKYVTVILLIMIILIYL